MHWVNKRVHEKGFTLVEFLLALGISAGLLAALYSMIYTAAKGWSLTKDRSEIVQTGRIALERIESDLEAAIPYGSPYFAGEKDSMEFYSVVSLVDSKTSVERKAVARIRYEWQPDSKTHRTLTRHWQVLLPQSAAIQTERTEVLAPFLRDIEFAFAFRDSPIAPIRWGRSWKQNKVPEGVRVRIQIGSETSHQPMTFNKTIRILQGSL